MWERIESAPLVGLNPDPFFHKKLVATNSWSDRLTSNAIQEYRRFVFLAVTADHPVSPSDIVDQVWHLHLMYTSEYWKNFCTKILGKPLHHFPAAGPDETVKFKDAYVQTLRSYKKFFGQDPPPEIWPAPSTASQIHQRINVAENWVIPKPGFLLTPFRKGSQAAI